MKVHDIEVEKIESGESNELSNTLHRVCTFCDKVVRVSNRNFKTCQNLSGNKFYCPFCLRNNFHHRSSRDVLIMSYRGIIGYYYYRFYDISPRKLWMSEIEANINKHSYIGLQNPVLSYDPSTYLWFINFGLVGNTKSKAPFDEVLYVIKAMYDVFNIKNNFSQYVADFVWDKFSKALTLFYQKRKRPKDRRILIPTFINCVYQEKQPFYDFTREFVKFNLVIK